MTTLLSRKLFLQKPKPGEAAVVSKYCPISSFISSFIFPFNIEAVSKVTLPLLLHRHVKKP